ncbi:hypothetical protein NCG97_00600 [Streptomyces lydicamycinicus]|uniref:hypothetical protein n=1 Tax=Streptomyces lydicamycinicus TaxID=1546107 RepID=UPI002034F931|nr:hypothetical protein [Streptomyces lydicamycinicus]URZ99512.1 hypothetical protein NCG97_00600 [Streptomyces lydicamycinicus]
MEPIEADSAPVDALTPLKLAAAPLPEARAAESGVPLVEAGDDPGYLIPQDVAAPGMPNGARCVDEWTSKLTDGQLSELRHVHADAFSDDEFHRGVQFIDSTTTSEPEKYLYDHFDDFREYAGDANRLVHAGGLRVRYPWRASTDTAQGPTTVSYSVSHALTKTETETKGWSAGGSLKLSIGKLGDATFSGSYTYSRTNSTAWTGTNTVNSTLKLDDKQWGRIDLFNAGGTYDGYLFFCTWNLPVAAEDHRYRVFHFDGLRFRCPYGLLVFPLKDFFVKSPDSPSPAVRKPRRWANGEKAPNTDFPAARR